MAAIKGKRAQARGGRTSGQEVSQMPPLDELALQRLGRGFEQAFEDLAGKVRANEVEDPAAYWADFAARALNRLLLLEPPAIELATAVLPFHARHRITTELFGIMGGGTGGGPTVDVLLQVRFDTEAVSAGFGIPLILRIVNSFGPVASGVWSEVREIAGKLNRITSAGRIVMIGFPDEFVQQPYNIETPIVAMPTAIVAGMKDPPHPSRACNLSHFANDLASGWFGDATLSGQDGSTSLEAFLAAFDVANLLRVRVTHDGSRHDPGTSSRFPALRR